MPLLQERSRIPWSNCRERTSPNGPHQSPRNHRLAYPYQPSRTMLIPRLWQLLQRLHHWLLMHCTSPPWSYKEGEPIAVEWLTMHHIWSPQEGIYIVPSPQEPRPQQVLHFRHWHIPIRCRSHHQSGFLQWPTSCSLLLQITPSGRAQLWHLW